MPWLNIRNNARRDALSVLGVMLYPSDQDRRAELLAVGDAADAHPDHPLSADVWRRLLNAPPLKEYFDKAGILLLMGWQAGEVLKTIAIIENSDMQASVRKAIHCVRQRCFGATTSEGRRVSYTQRSVYKGWKAFTSVAHLWAAAHSWGDEARPAEQLRLEWLREVQFGEFLALAEWFREFGERHVPSNQTHYGSTLNPKQTWRVPASYPLPEIDVSLTMPPWIREALKSYKTKSVVSR